MRVAIITTWFPNEKNPLFGVFVEKQAKALSQFCDITVLLIKRSLTPYYKEYNLAGVKVLEKGILYMPNISIGFLNNWASKYADFFLEIHEKNKFDLLHCHDHQAAYAGKIINLKSNIPYVVTLHHSALQNGTLANWRKKYIYIALLNASKNIAVGPGLSEILKEEYGIENLEVIPNYVDNSIFEMAPRPEGDLFKFIFVGSVEPRKGISLMIRAIESLGNEKIQLIIVGDGPQKKELEKYVKKKEISERVIFKGEVLNEDLPELYNSCHVYISLSISESFGISVLEAMSCGLPILYTKSGGPEYFVPEYAGEVVSSRNESLVAKCMSQMASEYDTYDRKRIRNHVLNNFSGEKVIERIWSIYNETVDKKMKGS